MHGRRDVLRLSVRGHTNERDSLRPVRSIVRPHPRRVRQQRVSVPRQPDRVRQRMRRSANQHAALRRVRSRVLARRAMRCWCLPVPDRVHAVRDAVRSIGRRPQSLRRVQRPVQRRTMVSCRGLSVRSGHRALRQRQMHSDLRRSRELRRVRCSVHWAVRPRAMLGRDERWGRRKRDARVQRHERDGLRDGTSESSADRNVALPSRIRPIFIADRRGISHGRRRSPVRHLPWQSRAVRRSGQLRTVRTCGAWRRHTHGSLGERWRVSHVRDRRGWRRVLLGREQLGAM